MCCPVLFLARFLILLNALCHRVHNTLQQIPFKSERFCVFQNGGRNTHNGGQNISKWRPKSLSTPCNKPHSNWTCFGFFKMADGTFKMVAREFINTLQQTPFKSCRFYDILNGGRKCVKWLKVTVKTTCTGLEHPAQNPFEIG